jgi:hypothetical protein
MTTGLHEAADLSAKPLELLRSMLEEQFAVHTWQVCLDAHPFLHPS